MKFPILSTSAAALLAVALGQHDHGHGEGVLGCDETNKDLLIEIGHLEHAEAVIHPEGPHAHDDEEHDGEEHDDEEHDDEEHEDEEHEDEEHEDEHVHEEEPEGNVYFLGCNNSHFDVLYKKHIYTYNLDVYEYEEGEHCEGHHEEHHDEHHDEDAPETRRILKAFYRGLQDEHDDEEGENCYRVLCLDHEDAESVGEEGHDENEEEGRRLIKLGVRSLQHDHDEGEHEEGEHDHGHEFDLDSEDFEGVDIEVNAQFYIEDYYLYTAHFPGCCVNATGDPHHVCDFTEFLEERLASSESGDDDSNNIAALAGALAGVCLLAAVLILVAIYGPRGSASPEAEELDVKEEVVAEEVAAEVEAKNVSI